MERVAFCQLRPIRHEKIGFDRTSRSACTDFDGNDALERKAASICAPFAAVPLSGDLRSETSSSSILAGCGRRAEKILWLRPESFWGASVYNPSIAGTACCARASVSKAPRHRTPGPRSESAGQGAATLLPPSRLSAARMFCSRCATRKVFLF